MEISNQKRSRTIKRGFFLIAVLLLLPILFFVWKEMDMVALINGGVFLLFIFGFQFMGLNYVHYQSDGDILQIRYYPIVSFFGKEYSSIEFNKKRLFKAQVERSFLFHELHVEIKTREGIAEYPEVSLAALSSDQIQAIREDLAGMLPEKRQLHQ
ncbi:hypothetical protein [Sunxiuqinia dokdonensis]|uniref:DUF304 domain-containing protein n=1 Tax=Sunxiuqinia dokdonensis TaxID=1409788 RepID=A0A0L8VEN6_9BACT|nr:hypothetical protein [Sunxiuqinia dokdonensis]KOH46627.1 hypothetical protein NC99_06040 [Sunxiuqinia dokdonensis]